MWGQAVTTLAGSGAFGSLDAIGTAAQFSNPTGICTDGAGNLFVADYANNCIRKIAIATGSVTTLAGSGTPGFVDATGVLAEFNLPTGICSDGAGNLFVVDAGNHSIRKIVIATGVVTTFAGTGAPGFLDATGTSAQFDNPLGVCNDGLGNLFVTDASNQRIRKIVIATGGVTTLAGSGTAGFLDATGTSAQFNFPNGVCSDGAGNLFVGDESNFRIRKIVIATGVVTTLAGTSSSGFLDATGTAAQFASPRGVWSDGAGNLFVGDAANNRIRKIIIATGVVTTLAGNGIAGFLDANGTTARFNYPNGIYGDGAGNLFVADVNNNRIRKIGLQTTSYSWNGSVSTDYQNPANWTPPRTTPAANDVLVFPGTGGVPVYVNNVPTQTIGQLLYGTSGIQDTYLNTNLPNATLTITNSATFNSGRFSFNARVPFSNNPPCPACSLNVSVPAAATFNVNGTNMTFGLGALRVAGTVNFTNTFLGVSRADGVNGTSAGTGTLQTSGAGTINYFGPSNGNGFIGTGNIIANFDAQPGKPARTNISNIFINFASASSSVILNSNVPSTIRTVPGILAWNSGFGTATIDKNTQLY